MNYYNEWDSFAADWLRELIKDGLIPDGEVDNRSIADVRPEDLKGFTQCHFFAGIGGWSRALQLAGWSSDRPVWTGSPPCQSFSTAGKGKGKDDERHLWPVFFNLIRECQPTTVFGEQVAAAIRYGWLDDLQNDFEAEGYASGAFVLPAGGIGAPHKRDRLFFVADSHNERHEWSQEARRETRSGVEHTGSVSMADTKSGRHKQSEQFSNGCSSQSDKRQSDSSGNCESQRQLMGYSNSDRSQQGNEAAETAGHGNSINAASFWAESEAIYCRDGKHRPIPTEPALFPMANGISNRVGLLRGAGNAIVPQAAAEIIKAYLYD
jgi:DNA (cytosine-5)-methyltransferase 1